MGGWGKVKPLLTSFEAYVERVGRLEQETAQLRALIEALDKPGGLVYTVRGSIEGVAQKVTSLQTQETEMNKTLVLLCVLVSGASALAPCQAVAQVTVPAAACSADWTKCSPADKVALAKAICGEEVFKSLTAKDVEHLGGKMTREQFVAGLNRACGEKPAPRKAELDVVDDDEDEPETEEAAAPAGSAPVVLAQYGRAPAPRGARGRCADWPGMTWVNGRCEQTRSRANADPRVLQAYDRPHSDCRPGETRNLVVDLPNGGKRTVRLTCRSGRR